VSRFRWLPVRDSITLSLSRLVFSLEVYDMAEIELPNPHEAKERAEDPSCWQLPPPVGTTRAKTC